MWTFVVAVSWLVLQESKSSGWVGITTFASMLPFLVFSPISGLIADRFDRRNITIATMVAGTATLAGLTAMVITDVAELWHIAILTFLAGTMRATQEPAMGALIPNQVPREHLLNAISLTAATRHGAKVMLIIAAPLLAIDSFGVTGVLILSAALKAVGAALMLRTSTASRGESEPEHGIMRSMVEGLAYIYSHQTIALFIILVAFHCALVMSFESILPIFSRQDLGASDGSILGYLVAGFGAGALMGTLLIAGVRDDKRKGRLLLMTGLGGGVAPMFLALSPNVPLAVLFATGMGISQATFMALTNTYVQAIAPDRLRGRIVSLYTLHAGGIMAFANLGYGFLADSFSAPPIFFTTGVIFILVLVSLGAAQPSLRRIYRYGEVVTA